MPEMKVAGWAGGKAGAFRLGHGGRVCLLRRVAGERRVDPLAVVLGQCVAYRATIRHRAIVDLDLQGWDEHR